MTPKQQAAMQQALQFLTNDQWGTWPYMDISVYHDAPGMINVYHDARRVATALQEALSEPVQEPVGYLPAYELDRLKSGHDGRLRSAKFGASVLDGDVAVYAAPPQRKPKPVAWRAPNWGHGDDEWVYRDFDDPVLIEDGKPSPNNEPLYAAPPQREWVALTDEDLCDVIASAMQDITGGSNTFSLTSDKVWRAIIRMVEAKLKEKNT